MGEQMEKLRLKIIEDCNNSGLPLEAIYFIIKDIFRDVSDAMKQQQEQEEQKEDKQNDN